MGLTPKNLSDRRPDSITTAIHRSLDVSEQTEAFLLRYFPECFTVTFEQKSDGYIDISPPGLAYIFKTVFFEVFGKSVIDIVFNDSPEEYDIRISHSSDATISAYAEQQIRSTAYDSGFWIVMGKLDGTSYINLKAKKRLMRELSIYARSTADVIRALVSVFF